MTNIKYTTCLLDKKKYVIIHTFALTVISYKRARRQNLQFTKNVYYMKKDLPRVSTVHWRNWIAHQSTKLEVLSSSLRWINLFFCRRKCFYSSLNSWVDFLATTNAAHYLFLKRTQNRTFLRIATTL